MDTSQLSRALSMVFGVALIAGISGLIVFVIAPIPATTGLTEFYVLGPNGQAGNYSNATVGEPKRLIVGVENNEHEQVTYRFVAEQNGSKIVADEFTLADGERWREEITVTFESSGRKQLDFVLYRDGGSEPYRELYVQLNVTEG